MYCNWCGREISEIGSFCQSCGRAVGAIHSKKLVRPRAGRKIAGVALALANYFDLDVTGVRLIWVLVAVFGGCGVLAYFVGWLLIPQEPEVIVVASAPQQAAG